MFDQSLKSARESESNAELPKTLRQLRDDDKISTKVSSVDGISKTEEVK